MSRKGLWLAALAALLVLSLGTVALANEVAASYRGRLNCGDVPREPVTIEGLVTAHEWNALKIESAAVVYTIKTGPFKVARNLPDLTGQTVTVDGYGGPGTNSRLEQAEVVNLIRARTITACSETYDFSQVAEGQSGPIGGRNAGARGGRGQMIRKAIEGSTL